jgi:hypothetical protein
MWGSSSSSPAALTADSSMEMAGGKVNGRQHRKHQVNTICRHQFVRPEGYLPEQLRMSIIVAFPCLVLTLLAGGAGVITII